MARIEDTFVIDHNNRYIGDVTLRAWGFIAGAAIFLWGLCAWGFDLLIGAI